MKHLSKLIAASVLVLGINSVVAQDERNPWAVELGINAVDTYPVGVDEDKYRSPFNQSTGEMFDNFFDTGEHWNILPSVSRLAVSRHISNGFIASLAGSLNRIKKAGDISVDDLTYYAADLELKYSFKEALNSRVVDPYLGIGGGYTWIDEIGFGSGNGTLGLRFWFTKNLALNLQTIYKHAFDDEKGVKHFQHVAGITFAFGIKDADGDGVPDDEDECPDTPGLAEFNGCPDGDGDGIPDHRDDCPHEAGSAEHNGCPDRDGDGIPDHQDECPDEAGSSEHNGCPDGDGDGVPDHQDECPDEAGPAENKGCPWPDRDGDGVPDHIDECPDVEGPASNNGCPEATVEVIEKLTEFSRTILFDVGKSTIRSESYGALQSIADVMKEYPNAKFHIEGHTDSTGSLQTNERLSKERAAAVMEYLINIGMDRNRLSSEGYGPHQPIADNNTAAGRQLNRRVDISLQDE